jgi:hypothetical protein
VLKEDLLVLTVDPVSFETEELGFEEESESFKDLLEI